MTKPNWNDEKIANGIIEVMDILDIDRMPSNNEINRAMGNTALSNRVGKTYGFYGWADRLNIGIKESETSLGVQYEYLVKNILVKEGYKVESMSTKHPYDLLVNGAIKIDVKVSNLYSSDCSGDWHTFNLEKKYPTCDIYVAVTLLDNEIDRIFIIPSNLMDITQLSVGKESIYNKYIDRWDYIYKYDKFYKSLE